MDGALQRNDGIARLKLARMSQARTRTICNAPAGSYSIVVGLDNACYVCDTWSQGQVSTISPGGLSVLKTVGGATALAVNLAGQLVPGCLQPHRNAA